MSLIFMDGFDHIAAGGELKKWDGQRDATDYSATVDTGRDGRGRSLKIQFGHLWRYVPAQSEYIVGFAYKTDSLPTGNRTLIYFGDGKADTQVTLKLTPAGKLQAYCEDVGPTALGTPTQVLSTATWYYIEFRALIHATAGSVSVRINGTVDSSASDVETQVADSALVTNIYVGNGGDVGKYGWFDDLYICDTNGSRNKNFLGDCRIDTLLANGNGANSEWTGSDGNQTDNYALVDEDQGSFSDYVKGTSASQVDCYTFGDLPITPPSVAGVQVSAMAKRNSALFRKIALVSRVGGVNYVQGGRYLSTDERFYRHINEVQPSGAGAWTKDVIDGAQFGVQVLA